MDDLIADAEEAKSDLIKQAKWDWYTDTATTRLEPGGALVMPGTRWAEDDVAGRILNSPAGKDWTVLVMPAIAEPNVGSDIASQVREVVTLADRPVGTALFPERYDERELERIQVTMSPLSFSALYQQRPSSAEGNLFKRDWWNYWTEGVPPVVQGKRIIRKPKKFVRVYHFVDSAFKTGIANDFSVCATWAKDDRENFYLLALWRDRVEFPALVDRLERIYMGLRAPIVIEDKASGQSAIQVLRSSRKARVVAAKYKGDHADRAESVTQIIESGKAYLPWEAPWVDGFIEEHAKFPTGAHDDQVDTTSMALLKLDKVKAGRAATSYQLGEVKATAKTWDVFGEHTRTLEKALEDREEFEARFV
jgi:predicted phage terminase large subunit-like protein